MEVTYWGSVKHFWKFEVHRSRSSHNQIWAKMQLWILHCILMYQVATFVNQNTPHSPILFLKTNMWPRQRLVAINHGNFTPFMYIYLLDTESISAEFQGSESESEPEFTRSPSHFQNQGILLIYILHLVCYACCKFRVSRLAYTCTCSLKAWYCACLKLKWTWVNQLMAATELDNV